MPPAVEGTKKVTTGRSPQREEKEVTVGAIGVVKLAEVLESRSWPSAFSLSTALNVIHSNF